MSVYLCHWICLHAGGKILARYEAPAEIFLFPEPPAKVGQLRTLALSKSRNYQVRNCFHTVTCMCVPHTFPTSLTALPTSHPHHFHICHQSHHSHTFQHVITTTTLPCGGSWGNFKAPHQSQTEISPESGCDHTR